MSNASDLFGGAGGKPKRITTYASGTGTYVPTENNARLLVFVQGGGSPGLVGVGYSGGGGAMVYGSLRCPIAGLPWAVGAGGLGVTGLTGNAGAKSYFFTLIAEGATAAFFSNSSNYATARGGLVGSASILNGSYGGGVQLGVSGGCGAQPSSFGFAAGSPGRRLVSGGVDIEYPTAVLTNLAANSGVYSGGSDSYFGQGTAGNNGANSANAQRGAGSGACASGTSGNAGNGYIEIWDFGA